jgi:hypothetical protein
MTTPPDSKTCQRVVINRHVALLRMQGAHARHQQTGQPENVFH